MDKNFEYIGFRVRIANENDLQDIKSITKEAFVKYAEEAGLDKNIAALCETDEDILNDIKTKIVLIAFMEGVPVGSVRVKVNDDKTAYLSRFGVRLNYQNNGVGKAIMNVVDNIMKDEKVKRIELHTASKFYSLVRFYYGRKFYIKSTEESRGYTRALLCKEYN